MKDLLNAISLIEVGENADITLAYNNSYLCDYCDCDHYDGCDDGNYPCDCDNCDRD